jgi:hypothetical protein
MSFRARSASDENAIQRQGIVSHTPALAHTRNHVAQNRPAPRHKAQSRSMTRSRLSAYPMTASFVHSLSAGRTSEIRASAYLGDGRKAHVGRPLSVGPLRSCLELVS